MSHSREPGAPDDFLDLPLSGESESADFEPVVRVPSEIPESPSNRGSEPERSGRSGRSGRSPRRRSGWLWLILLLAFPIGAMLGYLLSSDPPLAVVSSDLLDFGEARLGGSEVERTVRLSNQGEQALWMTGTALVGEAAEDYRILADTCAGLELESRTECAVRLAFRPAVRGSRRAQVRFDSNAVNGAQAVPLIGVGVQAELSIEPLQLDLGRQIVGDPGASGDLRLENRGTASVRLGRIELSGRHGADFLRVADDCSAQSLVPGARCSVRFTFVPRQAGERRATVRIENNGSAEPATATLVAYAEPRQPLLRLYPAALDFGSLRVGETSPTLSVNVANDGNVASSVRQVRIVPDGAFELVAETCSGREIAPSRACQIQVRFRPSAETSVRASLEMDSSVSESAQAESAQQVLLTGIGTAPGLRVEPQRLSFGAVGLRSDSPIHELHLINDGTAELTLGEITVGGSDASSFAFGGCSGTTLAPGEDCAVSLRFRPRRSGPHRANLVIRHNADRRPHQLAINGLGVAARLALRPQHLTFGEVRAGREASRQLVIENVGRASLSIPRLRLTGSRSSGFDLIADRCSGAVLEPAETCSVQVRFRPTSTGTRSIRLVIESSADSTPREVPIEGTATAP